MRRLPLAEHILRYSAPRASVLGPVSDQSFSRVREMKPQLFALGRSGEYRRPFDPASPFADAHFLPRVVCAGLIGLEAFDDVQRVPGAVGSSSPVLPTVTIAAIPDATSGPA